MIQTGVPAAASGSRAETAVRVAARGSTPATAAA
jgi:hypothetical protein